MVTLKDYKSLNVLHAIVLQRKLCIIYTLLIESGMIYFYLYSNSISTTTLYNLAF